jgi:hypothetical protein
MTGVTFFQNKYTDSQVVILNIFKQFMVARIKIIPSH